MGTRKLLREGVLIKAKSGRRLRAFLCSDILVLTEVSVKALYRMVRRFPSATITLLTSVSSLFHYPRSRLEKHLAAVVRDIPPFLYATDELCTDDLVFQIALAYPRGGDKINFKATSARDCQLWMQALEKASHECRQAEMRAAKRRQSRLSVT